MWGLLLTPLKNYHWWCSEDCMGCRGLNLAWLCVKQTLYLHLDLLLLDVSYRRNRVYVPWCLAAFSEHVFKLCPRGGKYHSAFNNSLSVPWLVFLLASIPWTFCPRTCVLSALQRMKVTVKHFCCCLLSCLRSTPALPGFPFSLHLCSWFPHP